MTTNRVIQVNAGVVGPRTARSRTVQIRLPGDYAHLSPAYLEIAQTYASPLLFGPPLCDELMALVQHMFTPEEAALVQYIKSPLGRTARALAAAACRPLDQVEPLLEHLVNHKGVLTGFAVIGKRRYGLLPLMPGAFETVLFCTSMDVLTSWHHRFAELFTDLYETGFIVDYTQRPVQAVRYLPLAEVTDGHPLALPADRLEMVLDRHDRFAVGLCQCRLTGHLLGRGCGRPMENCVGFGDVADYVVQQGRGRRVTKRDVIEIKAEAEAAGLVTWVSEIDVAGRRNGISCSCCGCCCHAMRTVSEFSAPGMFAPPHFLPQVDLAACTYCARCARACPMGAITVDTRNKSYQHAAERCIGCGLCALACDRQQAIEMVPNPDYHKPPQGLSALLQLAPSYLRNTWSAWRKRQANTSDDGREKRRS
ncbi:MAG: 4Fe-4S binding protein [Anaerolineae bacterium]|nr:4Fe-4S binding protein [Anaerolineae bacterium]